MIKMSTLLKILKLDLKEQLSLEWDQVWKFLLSLFEILFFFLCVFLIKTKPDRKRVVIVIEKIGINYS